MTEPRILIPTGYGLNCEAETERAFKMVGAKYVQQVHLSDIFAGDVKLRDHQILAWIGGFSFGDHGGAGIAQSVQFGEMLKEDLHTARENGTYMIGICNGFQNMVKLGLVPGFDGDYTKQHVSLDWNNSGVFRDAWVRLGFNQESPCVFTKGLEYMDVPIRHGEGKFVVDDDLTLFKILEGNLDVAHYVDRDGTATMEFPDNPNGSKAAIAGLCDPTGRIFGLMPHPEAYIFPWNHPQYHRRKVSGTNPEEGAGLQIFRNVLEEARKD
jgi:phosphoribosylformylglycinamidine synthase